MILFGSLFLSRGPSGSKATSTCMAWVSPTPVHSNHFLVTHPYHGKEGKVVGETFLENCCDDHQDRGIHSTKKMPQIVFHRLGGGSHGRVLGMSPSSVMGDHDSRGGLREREEPQTRTTTGETPEETYSTRHLDFRRIGDYN